MKDEKLDNFYNLELLKDKHSITEIFLRYELRLRLCWRQNESWAQSFKKCHQDRNSITNFCHELQVTNITVTVTCTFTIISSVKHQLKYLSQDHFSSNIRGTISETK